MLPGKTFTPEEVIRILLRYRWLILLPVSFGLALAPVVDRHVPELYRSVTLITVIPQQVPDSFVRSTVTGTIADRLPSISEQILSRSWLERIIMEFDLYREERANGIMQDVVERMRSDIVASPAGSASFRVSYASRDPETARMVTERLARLYIDESVRDRLSQAEGTSDFLETKLEEARLKLVEQEGRLEAYRRRYSGQLPEQLGANLQAIQNAQAHLQAMSARIDNAHERRRSLERELAAARALPAPAPELTTAQKLEAEQARLGQVSQQYRPGHPEYRKVETAIRHLEQQLEEERSRPQPAEGPDGKLRPADLPRFAYERSIEELEERLAAIDRQMEADQKEEARLKEVIAEYQARVDATPTRETELIELTRDYETFRDHYKTLLSNHEASQLSASLEHQNVGAQFRVLDPASLPTAPDNQRERLVLMFSGAGSGLFLGLALMGLLVYRNSTFTTDEEVTRLLELPVLAQVPAMPSLRTRTAQRRRRLALDIAGTAVVMASAAVLVAWGLERL